MKKFWLNLSILIVLILGACGNDQTKQEEDASKDTGIELTEAEQVDSDQVVATVNGREIYGDIYNFVYAQIKVGLHQLGYESEDLNEVKDLTLSILINQELLKQDAEHRQISVSESEIEAELEMFKANMDMQFSMLENQPKLSEEAYKDQLRFELIHEKYLESEIEEVDVTDADIEAAYEDLKAQMEDIPDLADIKEQLKQELMLQKEQEMLQKLVEELENEAHIETFI